MKKYVIMGIFAAIIIAGVLSLSSLTGVDYSKAGEVQSLTFMHDGEEREYLLYIPENHTTDMPLVLGLHEIYGHNYNMVNTSGFNELAETNSFVVCYPQGLVGRDRASGWSLNGTLWNANFSFSTVDDLGFLLELTNYIQSEYKLSDKAYSFGFSNGGDMSYSLALYAPDKFSAVASIAGRMSGPDWNNRGIAEPVSVLHIHGDIDVSLAAYDPESSFSPDERDYDWNGAPIIDDIIAYWASVDECDDVIVEKYTDTIDKYSYLNGKQNKRVIFYKVSGLSHKWPNEDYFSEPDVGNIIWNFFSEEE